MGMYPQTVVPLGDNLHDTLTNGMDAPDSGVIFTGDYYTANKDIAGWDPTKPDTTQELNPVYEYANKRYVRVTPYAQGIAPQYQYNNNGGEIGQVASTNGSASTWRWFKVEPIKWIILNFNQLIVKNSTDIVTDLPRLSKDIPMELYAADVLISGVAPNVLTWQNPSNRMYEYLNNNFYNQAFSDDEQIQIQVSRIYNNTTAGENADITGLNSNHLTSGSGMNPTEQKVYMLSHYELTNPESPYALNGVFESGNEIDQIYVTRQLKGTDYARAHCFYININDYATYWTRTAYDGTSVYRVYTTGAVGSSSSAATYAHYGTRPALQLK